MPPKALLTVTDILRGLRDERTNKPLVITSAVDYRRVARSVLAAKHPPSVLLPQSDPLNASIDTGGRWIGFCPCGSAAALHPEWQYAACLSCGREWTVINFPTAEEFASYDAVLSLRPSDPGDPLRWYAWHYGQTVDDLIYENARYGWPLPEGAE
jgi:hypothetical protein